MIAKIAGKFVEQKDQSVIIDVSGLFYEIIVPATVFQRINDSLDENGNVNLITYHYIQMSQSSGIPTLIGFMSEIELDFFKSFIKVSGIGPKAAVKALNKPISDIVKAIDAGDVAYLKTLQGIGLQRAKEIVAKLQGKVGKFGLIQDHVKTESAVAKAVDIHEEALAVLMQLQYKRHEAIAMIEKALDQSDKIKTSEELLTEIYKQKVNG